MVADRRPRVLVVDDEEAIRSLLATTLRTSEFEVLEAESADQALRMLVHESIDAVLLDRMMPDMDGVEVLRWIRRTPATAQIPVLFVTGRDQVDDLVEGLGVGADDYVVKPFEPDEVVARLHRHLQGRSAWDEIIRAEVDRRIALVEAASAASAVSLEAGIRDLCLGLARLPGLRGVAVVELVGDAIAVLGGKGDDPVAALQAEHGPTSLDRHLVARTQGGAWLEPIRGPAGPSTITIAPVRADDTAVALLLALHEAELGTLATDRLHASVTDFAALASGVFGSALRDSSRREAGYRAVMRTIEERRFSIAFQRIVDLDTDATVGYEALARFDDGRPPLDMFADAVAVGAGHALEIAALRTAIDAAGSLPPDLHLSINVSPSVVIDEDLGPHLQGAAGRSLVIELSELEPVADYAALRGALAELGTNIMLSIDDAGSGFASLAHILALDATFVKLDRSWISGIDRDPAKRALVAGIENFAGETGATLIAEGLETRSELETVRGLGIRLGQGYLLGRPAVP